MTTPHFITSLHHPYVKHLVKLQKDNSYRQACQTIILEGAKPIKEVMPFVKALIYTSAYLPHLTMHAREEWHVTEEIVKKITTTVTPEGLLAEVHMPRFSSLEQASHLLALDGVSDPGNLGTLMRTALALGWDGLFLLPGCCDPYNEKVLRAARGAHFKLAMRKGSLEELNRLVQKNQIQKLAADLEGRSPSQIPPAKKRLLMLGNEGRGLSGEALAGSLPVTIPMPGEMESLNVAVSGGILLYLLKT
ncbi:MAG: RNA methyltransferase [Parachlamydia sp.]|jgi:TrmH family RNA methyltransferase|nr:RNA methyltransferase [Parachlamydia sp.]